MLREPETRDRAAFIELLASPEVHTYLGGPRPRDELEREMSGAPEQWPGSFTVDLDGSMIGQILLRRAPGHHRPAAAGKVDLGYLFLPRTWGHGYAAEACAAALDRFAGVLPGGPVVLATQTANVRSMRLAAKLGFTEVERFEAWDAEQWLGMWSPLKPSS
ncbi:GNAT family N-acetyltransferase [Streptomyces sp. NPDC056178]|uniref:GNAT family N-acetyltransferase n=1 Tax=Streptomyces sp. NPDC056178 TaxID=3345735 RepID=UPI0035DAD025